MEPNTIICKRLSPEAVFPIKALPDAVGFDLFTVREETINHIVFN